jgi:uncharacterized protein YodC (DUF2158 family)
MPHELKLGDVVMLKSGGPRMTITRIDEKDGSPMICCEWFNPKLVSSSFPPEALEKWGQSNAIGDARSTPDIVH